MLSTPLPAEYPVPTALPALVLRVLEAAVRSPSAATLGPLYTIIKGVGPVLLQLLPPRKFIHLQDQLIKLLRNFDDHKVNLLCLAIFALLCSNQSFWPGCEDNFSPQEILVLEARAEGRSEDICGAARLFFTSKAQKTMELVVLRAIMSCSSSMTPSDAISSLTLAGDILHTVDTIERTNWVQNNMAKVRKLHEKVRKPNIDRTVQLVALEVIASLSEAMSLPDGLIATIERLLQRLPPGYDAKRIWKAYAANFSEAFMKSQISRVLRAVEEADRTSVDHLAEVNDMILYVESLIEVVKTKSTVRQMLLVILSSNGIHDSIWRFLSSTPIQAKGIANHERQEACMVQLVQARRLLGRDLCLLLLKSAFFTSSKNLAIDPCLATSLLESAISASMILTPCNTFPLARARFEPAVLVPSVKAHHPGVSSYSQDWRADLKENLDLDAACRHELVVQKVNELCRDLEARCNNAESPLKAEQKWSKELVHELETYKAKCTNLEVEAQENMLKLVTLQTSQMQLVDQKDAAERRARELSENLDQLRLRMILCSQEAKEMLRQQELSHFASVTAKDELLESEAQRIALLETTVGQVQAELRSAESACGAVSTDLAEVYETVKERDAKIIELENLATSHNVEYNHQADIKAAETEVLKGEVSQVRSEIETLKLKENQSNDKFDLAISDLQKKHEHEIATKDAENLQQMSKHELAETALRNELATTLQEAARQTESHNVCIGELLDKIKTLRTEREMRATEFAEAQDLSSKLMALMGKPPNRPAATSLSIGVSHLKSNMLIETRRGEDAQAVSHQSSGSSALWENHGSLLKRPRVQRNFKTPALSNTEARRIKSARRPLEDLEFGAQNEALVVQHRSTKGQHQCETGSKSLVKPTNEQENMLLQDMHEFSFANSHVFTSTDYHEVNDGTMEEATGLLDETTADF
ncbi:hypothetical protein MMC11_007664 [Xylographa trunciseda]|nr:hypothetical protein [Xylographa trunciseda]